MRHQPVDSSLFSANRKRLACTLEPQSVAVVNANDLLPVNADATLPMQPNSDLFYLSGIEQEESILLLAPNSAHETWREILFIREPNELMRIWEGHKLSRDEASRISGIKTVHWLSDFPAIFRQLMHESNQVYLNQNEHGRASSEMETREDRFVRDCLKRFPLQQYKRLAPLLHRLRLVKSEIELELMQKAVSITNAGFKRVFRYVRPGINEAEIEAEFAHEFIRSHAYFAYSPIVASGSNACILHYQTNDRPCRDGDLLLLDVGAKYANYSADLTRTIPVNGRFTRRQKAVYNAVLRVMRAGIEGAVKGKTHRDWTREAQEHMNEELLELGLLKPRDIRNQTPGSFACRKYFMHGLGHALGLDVHDVGSMAQPFEAGWVLTVEPGLYIPEEGFGIRLENNVLITTEGPKDLTADVPVEAEEIEERMAKNLRRKISIRRNASQKTKRSA